jgi:hypothetical protein
MVVAASVAGAIPASAGDKRQPLPPVDAVANCTARGFAVHVTTVRNKEYATTTTLPDGTAIVHVTGSLVSRLTNTTTGKATTVNVSGPGKFTFHPDGTFDADATGQGLWPFSPHESAAFGVPELAYIVGHLQASFGADGTARSVSIRGQVTDLCAALA